MDGCRILQYSPEQTEQGGLALVLVAELVTFHVVGMALGEGMVAVVQVGAVPGNAQLVEPSSAELGFKALAEVAFGLRIQVDATGDVSLKNTKGTGLSVDSVGATVGISV